MALLLPVQCPWCADSKIIIDAPERFPGRVAVACNDRECGFVASLPGDLVVDDLDTAYVQRWINTAYAPAAQTMPTVRHE